MDKFLFPQAHRIGILFLGSNKSQSWIWENNLGSGWQLIYQEEKRNPEWDGSSSLGE